MTQEIEPISSLTITGFVDSSDASAAADQIERWLRDAPIRVSLTMIRFDDTEVDLQGLESNAEGWLRSEWDVNDDDSVRG